MAKKLGRPKSEAGAKKLRSIKLRLEFETDLVRAAYWARTSVNAIFEEGAALMLKKLEKAHNGGKPFPAVPGE